MRAHLLLCMLAYAVRFEIEQRLGELLFADDTPLAPADPCKSGRSRACSRRPRPEQ